MSDNDTKIQLAEESELPSLKDVVERLRDLGAPEIMAAAVTDDITVDEAIESLQIMDAIQSGPNKSRSRSDLLSAILIRHGAPAEAIAKRLYAALDAKKYIPQDSWENDGKGRRVRMTTLVEVEDTATQSWALDTMIKIMGYYHKEPRETGTKVNVRNLQILTDVENTPVEQLLEEATGASKILDELQDAEDADAEEVE